MGRFFFSVLRGGGDEMVREDTKSGQPQRSGCPLGADVHAGGADLILSVDFTWVGYSDEKRRKSNLTATGCQIEDDPPISLCLGPTICF